MCVPIGNPYGALEGRPHHGAEAVLRVDLARHGEGARASRVCAYEVGRAGGLQVLLHLRLACVLGEASVAAAVVIPAATDEGADDADNDQRDDEDEAAAAAPGLRWGCGWRCAARGGRRSGGLSRGAPAFVRPCVAVVASLYAVPDVVPARLRTFPRHARSVGGWGMSEYPASEGCPLRVAGAAKLKDRPATRIEYHAPVVAALIASGAVMLRRIEDLSRRAAAPAVPTVECAHDRSGRQRERAMSFSLQLTSHLTGATRHQLQSWRQKNLLVPEVRSGRPPLYSFRDLVALRTMVYLRGQTSNQRLSKALGALDLLDLTDHPSRYQLATDGDTIVLQMPDSGQIVDLVKHPGNAVDATFEDVFRSFRNFKDAVVVDFKQPSEHVSVDLRKLGGWPTITGTRVPYDLIANLVDSNTVLPEDVDDFYPNVSAAAARDALSFSETVAAI